MYAFSISLVLLARKYNGQVVWLCSKQQKASHKSGVKSKQHRQLKQCCLASWKRYFQPKAWLRIQSVTATDMKNRPSPTGLPQLNHEPHARQCFMLVS